MISERLFGRLFVAKTLIVLAAFFLMLYSIWMGWIPFKVDFPVRNLILAAIAIPLMIAGFFVIWASSGRGRFEFWAGVLMILASFCLVFFLREGSGL